MAIRVSSAPALQRLVMLILIIFILAVFITLLGEVRRGDNTQLCLSTPKSGPNTTLHTCWTKIESKYSKVLHCPFTLLFAAVILFSFSFFMFITASLLKCLCPEVIVLIKMISVCRHFTRYYQLVAHLAGSSCVLAFMVFTIIFSYDKQSCWYTADIMRNCHPLRHQCWMLCLTFTSFAGCLFVSMLSAFESRKFNYERLDSEKEDGLYNAYINDSSEFLATYPS